MAKTKTPREKKQFRFNAIYALIILLVILAVLGVYFRYSIIDFLSTDKNNGEYVVTFSIDNVRYTTPANYIDIGDRFCWANGGKLLGTLMSEADSGMALNITPASEYFVDDAGQIHEVFYPNNESRVNARGRLLCYGSYSEDGGFYVDGTDYIAPGQTIAVHTERVSVSIRIISIEQNNA